MTYFEKVSAGKFEEINSGEVVTKAEITNGNALRKHEEEQALQVVLKGNTASVNYNPPSGNVRYSVKTSYVPRNYEYIFSSYYKYNDYQGVCLAIAAATVIAYYQDHISNFHALRSYVTSTGETLVTWFAPDMYPSPPSTISWQRRTVSAINAYLLYSTVSSSWVSFCVPVIQIRTQN